jgi:hypothetical protein
MDETSKTTIQKPQKRKKTHCRIGHVENIDWKKVEIYSAKTWSNLMEAKAFSFNI